MTPIRFGALALLTAALASGSTGIATADSDSNKKKDSKSAPSITLTIDASKLPPDLLKQLLKYATDDKKAATNPETTAKAKSETTAKGKPAWATPRSGALPPGLAKKSKNHPGVIAFLASHQGNKSAPDKNKSKKKKKDDDDD